MNRPLGCLLLALGVFTMLAGGFGAAIALANLNRAGAGVVAASLVIGLVGIALLIVAVITLRRADAAKAATTANNDATGRYSANVALQHELDNTPYTVHYTPPVKGKHAKPSVLTISTQVDCKCEFHMVVETWFDKFCKRFGIAVEVQTGDEKFDDECYVRSDSPEFTAAYLTDPVKRIAILDLRRFGFPDVKLDDGKITATWTGFNPDTDHRDDLSAEVAARLLLLARNLPAHQPEFDIRTGSHRKMWQTVLWLFLVGSALSAFSLIAFTPIHAFDLLLRAAGVWLFGGLGFAYLSAWLVSGTSRSHLAWSGLMIGSLFLFPVGSTGAVALVNGLLDNSPATTRNALIVEKYTTKSKNSTKYHVRVESWRDPGDTESFQISSSEYSKVTPHRSRLIVVTHAGWLGVEWFNSKRVDAQPKP